MGAVGGLLLGLGFACAAYGWAGGVAKRKLESGRLTELTPKQAGFAAVARPLQWAGLAMFVLGVIALIVAH